MKKQDDPEWEIVDSLPNERKASRRSKQIRIPKKLLIGAGMGVAIVVLFPPATRLLLNLFRNLIAYWWLFALVAVYWSIKRRFKR